jgi:hypothetical protein
MSVLLETSVGDIVIDLEVDACPKTCVNFLKLCKVYYYNLNAFFNGKYLVNLSVRTIPVYFVIVHDYALGADTGSCWAFAILSSLYDSL